MVSWKVDWSLHLRLHPGHCRRCHDGRCERTGLAKKTGGEKSTTAVVVNVTVAGAVPAPVPVQGPYFAPMGVCGPSSVVIALVDEAHEPSRQL